MLPICGKSSPPATLCRRGTAGSEQECQWRPGCFTVDRRRPSIAAAVATRIHPTIALRGTSALGPSARCCGGDWPGGGRRLPEPMSIPKFPPTRSGPAALLRWPSWWNLKGVVDFRGHEGSSLASDQRGRDGPALDPGAEEAVLRVDSDSRTVKVGHGVAGSVRASPVSLRARARARADAVVRS